MPFKNAVLMFGFVSEPKPLIVCCSLQEIAETKLPDLNCSNVEAAMKIVAGTAKNMGINIEAPVAA